MPRPRKPTVVLVKNGAFKHDPKRATARTNEPEADGDIGEPPAHLTPAERLCWMEIVGLCYEGTLGSGDRLVIEHGARTLNALRSLETYDDTKLMVRLEMILGKLGLTPADRSRVSGRKKSGEEDPYAEFGTAG